MTKSHSTDSGSALSPQAEGWVLDVTCLGLNSGLRHLLAD